MANRWTDKQLKAISTSGCNVLVSAAAGSGKTAVLVQRIIEKITASDGPDVDRLVVVTFTKAAAAEMKQRIREALDKLLVEQPENERLLRQITLVHNAPITTIDSFCLSIVRNYFTDIDIDPGFRTADEGEIKLLENDVMEDMLEEYYAKKDTAFYDFVDAYGLGRNDSQIVDIILKLYRFARSYPYPEEWFDGCLNAYDTESEGCLENNPAVKYLYEDIRRCFIDYDRRYNMLEEMCVAPQGPFMYEAAIRSDHAGIKMILEADNLAEIVRRIRLICFDTLGRSRSKEVSEEKKAYVKQARDNYKAFVTKSLKQKVFIKNFDEMLKDVSDNLPSVKMMLELAKDFFKRMQEEKRERNIIDFNDMEHLALEVLVKREEDGISYTKAADDLREYYSEILIDEYQDSNMLQEVILTAVSKGNNIYMVGDVKQSIYKFRLACPKLFIEKYDSYTEDDSPNIKIELQTNFRSRENVLECTNDVFKRAMNPEFAEILYDERARLNPGFEYPKCKFDGGTSFEEQPETIIKLIDTKQEESEEETEQTASEPELSDREVEAAAAAGIIADLMRPKADGSFYVVYDKNEVGGYRPIRYSDIVVLTRAVSGWADTFVDVLMNRGIPAYCDSSEGYFDVREIKLLLSYLAVIDNPLQDIPMAAVLLSFFGGLTAEELTELRMKDASRSLYEAVKESDDEKIVTFLTKLNHFRDKSELLTVSDLLWELIYDTGYYDYVGTMPAGTQRQANLDMLLSKAAAFEKTSYSGLFQFLRYIERLQKYEVDFAEASVLGENENLVRVMSIHKSKGLEFPVVILAGMGKQINQMDSRGEVIIDTELGVGTNVVHLDKRTKNATFIKSAVSRKLVRESISEELRVLYVAMTRAREKLFMTGIVKDSSKALAAWQQTAQELDSKDAYYPYSYEACMSTYFDMVMPSVCIDEEKLNGRFIIECVSAKQLREGSFNESFNEADADIDAASDTCVEDIEGSKEEKAEYEVVKLPPYRYAEVPVIKPKVTVSELKRQYMEENIREEILEELKPVLDIKEEKDVPKFLAGEQKELYGSSRGTAYHRVMECLEYDIQSESDAVSAFLDRIIQEGRITRQQVESVKVSDIVKFLKSRLGERVKTAWLSGRFHTEQPFVFIDDANKDNNGQLIQGVIDLYIEEDDGYVIVDYKTDRVSQKGSIGEQELIDKYAVQLEYYKKALSQLTEKPVKEKIIYSFAMGKEIVL